MLDEELLARTRGQWRGSLPWRFGDKACDEKRSYSGLVLYLRLHLVGLDGAVWAEGALKDWEATSIGNMNPIPFDPVCGPLLTKPIFAPNPLLKPQNEKLPNTLFSSIAPHCRNYSLLWLLQYVYPFIY